MPDKNNPSLLVLESARRLTEIKIPRLTTQDQLEGEGRFSFQKIKSRTDPEEIMRDWRRLRARVVDAENSSGAGYPPVRSQEVSYLESLLRILNDKADDLHARREQQLTDRVNLINDVEGTEPQSSDRTVRRLEVELLYLKVDMQVVEYRMSIVKSMLNQISLLDTVQEWHEIESQLRVESEESKVAKSSTDGGDSFDSVHEKRTAIASLAVHFAREEKGHLPDDLFETYKDFLDWLGQLDHKFLSTVGTDAIRKSLTETGCWETGKSGVEGSNLYEVLEAVCAYGDVEAMSDEDLSTLEKSVVDSI